MVSSAHFLMPTKPLTGFGKRPIFGNHLTRELYPADSFQCQQPALVGTSTVFDSKTKQPTSIQFFKSVSRDGWIPQIEYSAFVHNQKVGELVLLEPIAGEKLFNSYWSKDTQPKLSFLYVSALEGGEKFGHDYKGVGTLLMRLAVMESQSKGFKGRLRLCASGKRFNARRSPVPFYYNLGFRHCETDTDCKILKQAMKQFNKKPEQENFVIDDIPMYLPENKVDTLIDRDPPITLV